MNLAAVSMLLCDTSFSQNYIQGQIVVDSDHPEWFRYYGGLMWFDPTDGSKDSVVKVFLPSGTNYFTRPVSFGDEVALYLFRSGFDDPLPVILSSFYADYQDKQIIVKWRTESEIENLGFILLRSTDQGQNYSEIASYEHIQTLKGQGTTSKPTDYHYADENVLPNQTYLYILQEVDFDGQITTHGPIEIGIAEISVIDHALLYQNYPNPFNSYSTISFFLSENNHVTLTLFDLLGVPIDRLVRTNLPAGEHRIKIDGRKLSSGNYFYELRAGKHVSSRKMQIVR